METSFDLYLSSGLFLSKREDYNCNFQINDDKITGANNSGLYMASKKIQKKRNKYQKIDDNVRQQLIDAVVKEGQMLKTAAKKYKINYSSAKSIFHTYKKEGRVNKKSLRDRYIKQYANVKPILPLRSISEPDPEFDRTQEIRLKQNSHNSSNLFNKEEQASATLLKAPRAESAPVKSNLNFYDSIIPRLHTPECLSINSGYKNPVLLLDKTLLQNISQPDHSMKLCEELVKLQNMVLSTLSLVLQKNNPIFEERTSISSLQNQLQSVPFPSLVDHKSAVNFVNQSPQGFGLLRKNLSM